MEMTTVVKGFNLAKTNLAKVDVLELIKRNPREQALADVMAYATSYEVTPNKKDLTKSSLKFFGQFEVQNRITGETINASSAYFPGPAEPFIKGLLDGNEGGGVRLGFQITVMVDKSPDSPTGYKYGMKLLTNKNDANDPFKELRGQFPPLAIEAPAKGKK
jgi:hypothetical protein